MQQNEIVLAIFQEILENLEKIFGKGVVFTGIVTI